MEHRQSTFNVVHWECNLTQLKKAPRFDVQIGVTGGWLDSTAVLQFRWRVMGYAANIAVLHLLAENNYAIPDLDSFDESKMKILLLESHGNLNRELVMRTNEAGNLVVASVESNFPEKAISHYYKEFSNALNAR